MPLVVTPGASNANSYLSLVEFQAYLNTRLHVPTVVKTADDATREAALITATRLINAYVCFTGIASSSTQALVWPRSGMISRNGFAVPIDTIPAEIKHATAELAILSIVSDRTLENQASADGIKKVKVASIQIEFKETISINVITDAMKRLLVPTWLCAEDANKPHILFDMV